MARHDPAAASLPRPGVREKRHARRDALLIQMTDYNNAGGIITANCATEWTELETVLLNMPLHLKASDQAGIQGRAIFDPVGTNEAIRTGLAAVGGWLTAIPIPQQYDFLGTDVDFGKNGLIVEAQFSNYPFLLNNTIRSELFFKAALTLSGVATRATIILTKAHMFPASNSTLYYEQAVNQLNSLATNNVFTSPIRLVGLFSPRAGMMPVTWTEYTASRYSRTVRTRVTRQCTVAGRTATSRCTLTLDQP